MLFPEIKKIITGAVYEYPFAHMHHLIEKSKETSRFSVWDCCFRASKACGGNYEMAIPAAAATYCMLVSIHLVDDLLDDDPNGFFQKIGKANTANLALAFQSLGYKILEDINASPDNKILLSRRISKMNMDTCLAQQQDSIVVPKNEEDYWKLAEAKTPPLFEAALFIGALSANASPIVAEKLSGLGVSIGKIIQVGDDLSDVFDKVLTPDWKKQYNNLPLLYANLADYEGKDEMKDLLKDIKQPLNLARAQDILIESGAVSYCLYHLLLQYKSAMELIQSLDLASPAELTEMIEDIIEGPREFLKRFNIELDEVANYNVSDTI